MTDALHITASIAGLAAGIFFITAALGTTDVDSEFACDGEEVLFCVSKVHVSTDLVAHFNVQTE